MIAPRTLLVSVMLALATTASPALAQDPEQTSAARVAPAPAPARPEPVVKSFHGDHPGHDTDARYRVRKWPGRTITYFDATKDSYAVKKAVRYWNRSGVDMTFRKIRSKKKADLLIRDSSNVPSGCGTGLATLGYTGRRQAIVNIKHGTDADGQPCAWPGQTLVVAHELGHVLGLRHDNSRCSLMNTSHTNGVAPTYCVTPDPADSDDAVGRWRCRVLEKIDIKRVKRKYGGNVDVHPEEWCDLGTRMPATGAVTVTPLGSGYVQVNVNHAAEPAQPAWLDVFVPGPAFALHTTPGDCAAPTGTTTVEGPYSWSAPVGADEQFNRALTPGPWCVTALAYDTVGRPALAGTSVVLNVT